jgi:hypothetical protein
MESDHTLVTASNAWKELEGPMYPFTTYTLTYTGNFEWLKYISLRTSERYLLKSLFLSGTATLSFFSLVMPEKHDHFWSLVVVSSRPQSSTTGYPVSGLLARWVLIYLLPFNRRK